MCCCSGCCKITKKVADKGNRTLRKECFSNICSQSRFFYWVIIIWILLIVLGIGLYSVLLVEFLILHDTYTSQTIMNILIHIINGLFTFAAVLNMPVRLSRLRNLYQRRDDLKDKSFPRKITTIFLPSAKPSFVSQSTQEWEKESELIFDYLAWGTQHLILQALLWNSIFQISNQVCRCIYYSYELSQTLPGLIYVNLFFPLAILSGIIAAMTQAVAENRFRDKNSMGKKPNNCKKTMVEFWHNLWKLQTDGKVALGDLDNSTLSLGLINLRKRTVVEPKPRIAGAVVSGDETYSGHLSHLTSYTTIKEYLTVEKSQGTLQPPKRVPSVRGNLNIGFDQASKNSNDSLSFERLSTVQLAERGPSVRGNLNMGSHQIIKINPDDLASVSSLRLIEEKTPVKDPDNIRCVTEKLD